MPTAPGSPFSLIQQTLFEHLLGAESMQSIEGVSMSQKAEAWGRECSRGHRQETAQELPQCRGVVSTVEKGTRGEKVEWVLCRPLCPAPSVMGASNLCQETMSYVELKSQGSRERGFAHAPLTWEEAHKGRDVPRPDTAQACPDPRKEFAGLPLSCVCPWGRRLPSPGLPTWLRVVCKYSSVAN